MSEDWELGCCWYIFKLELIENWMLERLIIFVWFLFFLDGKNNFVVLDCSYVFVLDYIVI